MSEIGVDRIRPSGAMDARSFTDLVAHLIARQPTLVRLAWACDAATP